MATYSKQTLSGSTQGKAIKVAATSSPGTTIHATGTSASTLDELWLYAYNGGTASIALTVQFGGTATPDNDIVVTLPSKTGLTTIVPGLVLTGTGTAANTVYAYAGTTNVVTLTGFVNRIA